MKYTKNLFSALLLLIFAASLAHAQQTTYGKITSIKAFSSQAYVYVEGMGDPFNCGNAGMARFYWTTPESDKLWSMLLAAQMSGKEVSFEGTCVSGRLSIEAIYLKS